jgi:hypothetical protein
VIEEDRIRMTAADEFVAQLEHVPWFENIGRATAPDELVDRIDRWEHWPGPEAPQVADFFDPQQVLRDSIFKDAGENRGELNALWDRVQAIVLRAASLAVPYDPAEDAWHGPTAAVWHAV